MEGNIWIESDGLGKGCTAIFIVKLGIPEPLNESKVSSVPKLAGHGQTNFPGLKVLVMDNNRLETQETPFFTFYFCFLVSFA